MLFVLTLFLIDDLAKILQDATEADAGAFRARGIPEAMKFIELIAIEQARSWGTCSLNEFRRFMGLKRTLIVRYPSITKTAQ